MTSENSWTIALKFVYGLDKMALVKFWWDNEPLVMWINKLGEVVSERL